jgi:hypothetical protein
MLPRPLVLKSIAGVVRHRRYDKLPEELCERDFALAEALMGAEV